MIQSTLTGSILHGSSIALLIFTEIDHMTRTLNQLTHTQFQCWPSVKDGKFCEMPSIQKKLIILILRHNFHHVFPWDYKTSELGRYWCNYSTCFLDICAWLGEYAREKYLCFMQICYH